KTVAAPALRLTAGRAVALAPVPHQSLSDPAPVLRAHHGHCGARVQPAAGVYRAVVVWSFGLFWCGGVRRGLYGEVSAYPLDGAVCARWSAGDGPDHGPVWRHLRALYAHLLLHPDHGVVASAVEPGLLVLLGPGGQRWPACANCLISGGPGRCGSALLWQQDRGVLLLRAGVFLLERGPDVGHCAFPVW